MKISEVIFAIDKKHKRSGITINPPASELQIINFEEKVGFQLPLDFKEFYLICNGFECTEDIFGTIPLEAILEDESHYGKDWFHFAEYMIYSDMWSLRKLNSGKYEIFNKSDTEVVLGSSLLEFLQRFLLGNVFDEGGLYEWQNQLKST